MTDVDLAGQAGSFDAYMWRHVAHHLIEAGRADDLRRLLLDPEWMERKLEATDVGALLADFDYFPPDEEIATVAAAIRLSAHVVGPDPSQLPSQLAGRLAATDTPEVRQLLERSQARTTAWLRPTHTSLTPPGVGQLATVPVPLFGATGAAITPDGTRALIGSSYDESITIWDLTTGTATATLEGHADCVTGVAITPDGTRAITGSVDQTVKIWDLTTGTATTTLEGHEGGVSAVGITADGTRAVSAGHDQTIKIWDLGTGTATATVRTDTPNTTAVAITADGRRAVSADDDKTVRVWDLATGAVTDSIDGRGALGDRGLARDMVSAVAISPDGTRAVSAPYRGMVKVWDLGTGTATVARELDTGWLTGVALTNDGTRAVSSDNSGTLQLWDLATGTATATLESHMDWFRIVAINADGTRALSASGGGTMQVWDLTTGSTSTTPEGHHGTVRSVAITPDGTRALSGGHDQTIKVWDLGTGTATGTLKGHKGTVSGVAITADGTRAVTASHDGTVKVWDLGTATATASFRRRRILSRFSKRFDGHTGIVTAVAITPDGTRAVSGGFDRTIKVWDLTTGAAIVTLNVLRRVAALAVTPDASRAVTASETVQIWDLASGSVRGSLTAGRVTAVAITADDSRAVTAGYYGEAVTVWDLTTRTAIARLEGHTGMVTAVAMTPDGTRAASAGEDQTVKVWDLTTLRLLATFTADGEVTSVGISADGTMIVAGDSRGAFHGLQLRIENPG